MRFITKFFPAVVMATLPANPAPGFAQNGPGGNQCAMIPEIMSGGQAFEAAPSPYQPENCVALNREEGQNGRNNGRTESRTRFN